VDKPPPDAKKPPVFRTTVNPRLEAASVDEAAA
jgi:hypothetical protein